MNLRAIKKNKKLIGGIILSTLVAKGYQESLDQSRTININGIEVPTIDNGDSDFSKNFFEQEEVTRSSENIFTRYEEKQENKNQDEEFCLQTGIEIGILTMGVVGLIISCSYIANLVKEIDENEQKDDLQLERAIPRNMVDNSGRESIDITKCDNREMQNQQRDDVGTSYLTYGLLV